jgi:hypothetical protein
MGIVVSWFQENWFSTLQTLGIVGGLSFNAYGLFINSRIRKVDTLINITQQHRAIWLKFIDSPNLKRILQAKIDLKKAPVTDDEIMFVNLSILHLTTVLIAVQKGIFAKPSGFDEDIQDFFSLPIPKAVWHKTKEFRDRQTINYVNSLVIG